MASRYPAARAPRTDTHKTELIGAISKVVFCDTAAPFSVLALIQGEKVVIGDDASSIPTSVNIRWLGKWESNNFGDQFRATSWVVDKPISMAGAVAYLSKIAPGVGDATARKLWRAYGPDCVRKLREEPATVAKEGHLADGVAWEASRALTKESGCEATKVELVGLLDKRGFPAKTAALALKKWGVRAADILKASAYRLMTAAFPGASWARCDRMYLELGGRPSALKRQALLAWSTVRDDRTGSTWSQAETAVDKVKSLVGGADPIRALKLAIRARWLRIRAEGGRRYLAITERAVAEERVADGVARLLSCGALWPTIEPSAIDGDGRPSAHQTGQLSQATAKAVGVFCGGPGTGKTFTLAWLLRSAIAKHGLDSVAVCAPTGKAAVRASESLRALGVNLRATTVHRLLGILGPDAKPKYGPSNLLPYQLVVCDEWSMSDTSLCAQLLDAICPGANLLLLGDTGQLPPVGHGSPLRDLIASGRVGVGVLTEVRRNAGEIVKLCDRIRRREVIPPIATEFDLEAECPVNVIIYRGSDNQQADVLAAIQKYAGPSVMDWQTLVPLNTRSAVSRDELNKHLQAELNPHGLQVRGCPFRLGDKVICTKNQSLEGVVPSAPGLSDECLAQPGWYQSADDDSEYVANGEIGLVVAIDDKSAIVSFGGGRMVRLPVRARKARPSVARGEDGDDSESSAMSDFDLAYAVTVHKSQGSEWPIVFAVIDKMGSMVCDLSYWITAASRGRTKLVLIGDEATFRKQVARDSLVQRRTFLVELLRSKTEGLQCQQSAIGATASDSNE